MFTLPNKRQIVESLHSTSLPVSCACTVGFPFGPYQSTRAPDRSFPWPLVDAELEGHRSRDGLDDVFNKVDGFLSSPLEVFMTWLAHFCLCVEK